MHPLAKVSICLLLIALLGAPVLTAAKQEYFTEDELDTIRDAQEMALRVPAYFKLAERRLIFLGLMEQSEKEKEKERKEREKRAKEIKKAGENAGLQKPPIDEMAYLSDFTRSELLRGYIQALEEVMTNIDDAYERKLEVRESLEDLEKFARDTAPLLQKFQPKNDSERAALMDALAKAKDAEAGARDALNVVPKTEKKRKN
jgi:hypothetical protein